jgi:hypothetical protein
VQQLQVGSVQQAGTPNYDDQYTRSWRKWRYTKLL